MRQDEDRFSIFYIKKIDSLLMVVSRTGNIPPFDFQEFTKTGGHIPGRYMALRIKQANLLASCIQATGDPTRFFEQYQAAVTHGNGPALSAATMAYLRSLHAKYR